MRWVRKWMSTSCTRKVFRKLVDLDEVIDVVSRYVKLEPLGIELIDVRNSIGRILAEDVRARVALPPFDRALFDGYAALSEDIAGARYDAPRKLRVVDKVSIGTTPRRELSHGECAEVATGASIPYPANVVVPIEYTARVGDVVEVYKSFGKGFGIQLAATDCVEGEILARRGTLVTPLLAAVMSGAGIDKVKVFRRIRVAVISIGNELREPGTDLPPGCIYESNSCIVLGVLKSVGAEPTFLGIVEDDEEKLSKVVEGALKEFDVVVTIGGTSAGEEDVTYRVLSRYSPGVVIHGLKIKPGTPTFVAIARGKLVVGLPGFPFSCLAVSYTLLRRLVAMLTGYRIAEDIRRAKLVARVEGVPGFRRFVPSIARVLDGDLVAYPLHLPSAALAKLRFCNSFASVPPDREYVESGEYVDLVLLEDPRYDLVFVGSHDPLIEEALLELENLGYRVCRVFMGSMAGVRAAIARFVDVAGIHLYDPRRGTYNDWVLEEFDLGSYAVIKLVVREQGFVYRPELGTVNGFREIVEKGLRFVNRNPGSGTRYLVDSLIEREAVSMGIDVEELRSRIRGYGYELTNHHAVALSIKMGRADVGVAIRYVAEAYGLGFRRLVEEEYDLLVRRDLLGKPIVEKLLEIVRKLVESGRFPGYRLSNRFSEVVELGSRR